MKKLIIVLSSLLLVLSCVYPKDFQKLKQRVDSLEKQERKSQDDLEEQIRDISKKLNALAENTQKMIHSNTNSVRDKQADLWSEVREQREKLAKIQGEQEVLKSKVKDWQNSSQNNTQYLQGIQKKQNKMEKQLSLISSQLDIHLPTANASQTSTQEDPPRKKEKTKLKPEAFYSNALDKFNQRKYEEAQTLWSEFIDNFPEHTLVPNAYFWQGECFFQMQNYSDAILKYQKVIENYSDSNKYPACLLKQGISFYKKDKTKPGKILLQDLIENFPDRNEAKRAKKFLQEH